MKLSRFLSLIIVATAFSLLYVFQQTEIFNLAYSRQKKFVVFEELLDKNSVLRYNIQKKASLVRIGDRVAESADFEMPDSYRLVKMPSAAALNPVEVRKESMLSRLFTVRNQAEAKTINP